MPTETTEPWSCGELDIIIHHYTTPSPYEDCGQTYYATVINKLIEIGMIDAETKRCTPKGCAFIEMLQSTPIPEQVWIDPRTKEVLDAV